MTASTQAQVDWRIAGEQVGNCVCAWGCPCQFNALPTHGQCGGFATLDIREGHFAGTPLGGTRVALLLRWPGAIHEGNGTRQLVVDERATPAQREALVALASGAHGHPYFQIFTAVCPNALETIFAPIKMEVDREQRQARITIPGVVETHVEPIKNPVTGEEHRARIVIPGGFEFKEAEVGNAVSWRMTSTGPLQLSGENTYAQLNRFDWRSDGSTN